MKLEKSIAREILLSYLPPNSCVSSTRFVIEALRLEGIEAFPLPVYALCITREEIVLLGRPESNVKSKAEWMGHLVAVTKTHIYDISLDQVNDLEPCCFEITNDFWNGIPKLVEQDHNLITYWIDENAPSPLETRAWNELWKEPFEHYLDKI